jgi:hypothetical protein
MLPPGSQDDEPEEIPEAPAFTQMSHLLSADRMILCYTNSGPAYGTVTDLLSMAITGKPGRGKTTALMYYVTMLLKAGAEVFVWDPHGAMGELAKLNGRPLLNLPATAKVTYLDRKQDIIDSIPTLMDELEVRDNYYRPAHQVKHPLLILADELPVLADYDQEMAQQFKQQAKANNKKVKASVDEDEDETGAPSLIKVIRKFVLEARKWNCYFIGSGQSFDASILPTRVTENFNSRIVFFSSDRRARMSGLENDAVKTMLPQIRRAGSGVMIFDCSRFDGPVIGAIPMISMEDMLDYLGVDATSKSSTVSTTVSASQRPQLRVVEAGGNDRFKAEEKPHEAAESDVALSELEERVLDFLQQGNISQNQIIKELWGTSGGDKYQKASVELRQIIAKLLSDKKEAGRA